MASLGLAVYQIENRSGREAKKKKMIRDAMEIEGIPSIVGLPLPSLRASVGGLLPGSLE